MPAVIRMEALNSPQDKVLNDSWDLSHLNNENKDGMQFHLLCLKERSLWWACFLKNKEFYQKNCIAQNLILEGSYRSVVGNNTKYHVDFFLLLSLVQRIFFQSNLVKLAYVQLLL